MRARALGVMGLGALPACKSSADTDGLVMVPMLETASSSSAIVADAGAEASVATRPTLEPRSPNGQNCTREVHCAAALPSIPTVPYAHPYEHCDPSPLGEPGKLSPRETNEHRVTEPDVCCYVSFEGCVGRGRRGGGGRVMIGRPLRDTRGEWVTAVTSFHEGWSEGSREALSGGHDERESQSAIWAANGAAEHASVAEFARLALSLLALGAPADLVRDVHRAALDEIAHARICFTMASRYAGRPVGPGRLAVERAGAGSASVAALVRDTLRDGCHGETAAALELRAMARLEADAQTAALIEQMADDEERHAELAWRILRFAMDLDPDATSVEIDRFVDDLERSPVADEIVRPCALSLVNRRCS